MILLLWACRAPETAATPPVYVGSAACSPCHVVGWPPTESAVGCESCHGAGSAHLAAPRSRMVDARQACAGCHTVDTSPDFVFPARWAAIKH